MELLAALEIEPVGVTTWEESFIKDPLYFPQPTTTQILDYDGDFPNLEQLAALKPDLVFGWQELGNALAGIAPVYNVANDQNSYAKSHEESAPLPACWGARKLRNATSRLRWIGWPPTNGKRPTICR